MKAVSVLLKQLMTARNKFHERERDASFDGKLEKLRLDLNKIKDLERKKLDEDNDDICKRIKDSTHKLLPMDAFDDSSKEEDHKGGQIFHSSQQLQQPRKEMQLICGSERVSTAQELGEDVIDDLWKCNVIVRYGNGKGSLINKFRILPNVHRELELPQWVKKFPNLEVLQLGRWQDSPLHHIEVGTEEFLKELRYLTQLKYLSLRGISRIFELPSSIAKLERLLVLDLKACHNLEILPNDISSMKSLTHDFLPMLLTGGNAKGD
ncbi:hypothetical protein VNO80_07663 [Phaseolus coccineus]|uniref:Uncharacterized protein n=1 Tax=Phaseolus coccineus TaxID=3886 RepID=A0AAN9NJP8_PHACN